MNPEIREMLLSHSIGIARAYYKPSDQRYLVSICERLITDSSVYLRRKR